MSFIDELFEIEKDSRRSKKTTKIKSSQFCGISKELKWYNWLGEVAPDLLVELRAQQKKDRSCRSNSTKMVDIQKKLHKRNLSKALVNFLKEHFPAAIQQTY